MITKNQIKIIAAIAMVFDHVGMEFFPQYEIFRIIGRLAFPIFAYSIFEGSRYTHDKLKYFLRIFILGLLCVLGYYLYEGEIFGNVLITFSLSILILFGVQYLKSAIASCKEVEPENKKTMIIRIIAGILAVGGSLWCAALLCSVCEIDYGFAGVMLPVYAELFDDLWQLFRPSAQALNKYPALAGLLLGLILLAIDREGNQYFGLLAMPLLLLESSRRGKYNMKYFFYIFYPAHLVVIGILSMIVL